MLDEEQLPEDKLPAQSRAARLTYLLTIRGEMKTADILRELGYPRGSRTLYDLIRQVRLGGVPIYQRRKGYWAIEVKCDKPI